MKKMNKKYSSKNMNQIIPSLSFPHIDKLSGTVRVKEAELFGLVKHEALNLIQTYEPGVAMAGASKRYPLALKLYYGVAEQAFTKAPHLLLQFTGKDNPNRHIRFECNPSHLTEVGEDHLNHQMLCMMGLTVWEFLAHAVFTRIDVCRDIGCSMEDVLIKAKWSKVSQNVFGKGGELETLYLGKAGGNQIVAYDKANELHGCSAAEPMTRIEARWRTRLTAKELIHFKNPLERVELYSLACKNPPVSQGHWRSFQDACRMRGINNALKMQPLAERKLLKKTVSANAVSWWDIAPEAWPQMWAEVLKNAGLHKLPENPPPFCMAYLVGQAA